MIKKLSERDFRDPGLSFHDDGSLKPTDRTYTRKHPTTPNG